MAITTDHERAGWQHRYNDSLARERVALQQSDDVTGTEAAAIETTGCLPGWLGAAVLTVTLIGGFIRRRFRRTWLPLGAGWLTGGTRTDQRPGAGGRGRDRPLLSPMFEDTPAGHIRCA